MKEPIVISLGGSVIAPDGVDTLFVKRFAALIRRLARLRRMAIVCGGGVLARTMMAAARRLGVNDDTALHWIGIAATKVHAELLRAILRVRQPVLSDYRHLGWGWRRSRIVVASGDVPGHTSDFGAVVLARLLGAKRVFNVTNVDGVYTADPRRVGNARRLKALRWSAYMAMVGALKPGGHAPFDAVAARLAERSGIRVVVLSSDLKNLERALRGGQFRGTVIGK